MKSLLHQTISSKRVIRVISVQTRGQVKCSALQRHSIVLCKHSSFVSKQHAQHDQRSKERTLGKFAAAENIDSAEPAPSLYDAFPPKHRDRKLGFTNKRVVDPTASVTSQDLLCFTNARLLVLTSFVSCTYTGHFMKEYRRSSSGDRKRASEACASPCIFSIAQSDNLLEIFLTAKRHSERWDDMCCTINQNWYIHSCHTYIMFQHLWVGTYGLQHRLQA